MKVEQIRRQNACNIFELKLENQSLEQNLKERHRCRSVENSLREPDGSAADKLFKTTPNYFAKRRQYMLKNMQTKYIKTSFTTSGVRELLKANGLPQSFSEFNIPISNFDTRTPFLGNIVLNTRVLRSHERDFTSIENFLKPKSIRRSLTAHSSRKETAANNSTPTARSASSSKHTKDSKQAHVQAQGHSLYDFKPYGHYKKAVEDSAYFIKAIIQSLVGMQTAKA